MNPRVTIWFAIVMSTVIYLVIILQLAPGEPGNFEQVLRHPTVMALYAVALTAFLVAWFVLPRVVKGNNAQTRIVVVLAMFEACAIFGLVGAFLTQNWRVYLAPWALALAGFIREFPRAGGGEPPAPV